MSGAKLITKLSQQLIQQVDAAHSSMSSTFKRGKGLKYTEFECLLGARVMVILVFYTLEHVTETYNYHEL